MYNNIGRSQENLYNHNINSLTAILNRCQFLIDFLEYLLSNELCQLESNFQEFLMFTPIFAFSLIVLLQAFKQVYLFLLVVFFMKSSQFCVRDPHYSFFNLGNFEIHFSMDLLGYFLLAFRRIELIPGKRNAVQSLFFKIVRKAINQAFIMDFY